ncbi:hypothetical protein COA17_07350 [Sphingomonas ginsenosidimutans]|jgi:hypothetical protein|uniref:Uncharacterized protein n=1 Tax=Sphingomonas ginsenosidimutans TaxID=862134 RepID=A0A2A4HYQ7_9SPHN|nr:hypothetical protein [Sphingomonas ginsenosidimutans]PCG09666.1 hypothetical protein COA17_07350 [Sphingomonas ginsenosidimutans]
MAEMTIRVRTLVHHDKGSLGTKAPGDVYEAPASEAGQLLALGVVEYVDPPLEEVKYASYGVVFVPSAAEVPNPPPWPPTPESLATWEVEV